MYTNNGKYKNLKRVKYKKKICIKPLPLHLETLRSSSTSSSLELSTLGEDSWGLVLVRTHTEVSNGLSRVPWTSQDQGVLTLWSPDSQLVKGNALTTSLDDSGSCTSSESQSSNSGLWKLEDSGVIGDGTNDDDGLVGSTLTSESPGDPGNRHWWSVDLGQVQGSQNNLVEWCISTTCIKSGNGKKNR